MFYIVPCSYFFLQKVLFFFSSRILVCYDNITVFFYGNAHQREIAVMFHSEIYIGLSVVSPMVEHILAYCLLGIIAFATSMGENRKITQNHEFC